MGGTYSYLVGEETAPLVSDNVVDNYGSTVSVDQTSANDVVIDIDKLTEQLKSPNTIHPSDVVNEDIIAKINADIEDEMQTEIAAQSAAILFTESNTDDNIINKPLPEVISYADVVKRSAAPAIQLHKCGHRARPYPNIGDLSQPCSYCIVKAEERAAKIAKPVVFQKYTVEAEYIIPPVKASDIKNIITGEITSNVSNPVNNADIIMRKPVEISGDDDIDFMPRRRQPNIMSSEYVIDGEFKRSELEKEKCYIAFPNDTPRITSEETKIQMDKMRKMHDEMMGIYSGKRDTFWKDIIANQKLTAMSKRYQNINLPIPPPQRSAPLLQPVASLGMATEYIETEPYYTLPSTSIRPPSYDYKRDPNCLG